MPGGMIMIKKRLSWHNLIKASLYSFSFLLFLQDSEGRYLSEMFRELPDKNEYPDYYKVIPSPIDLRIIREKIDSEAYKSEDELMEDFEIMFQNARHYNEENSEIYEDSVTLEKALKKKRRWLSHAAG